MRCYPNFLIGPKYPTPYPGQQFPVEAQDQYFAQLVPNTETMLVRGGANAVKALAELVDKADRDVRRFGMRPRRAVARPVIAPPCPLYP